MSGTLECKFIEEGSQLSTELQAPLTVGKEFSLNCAGELPTFDTAKIKAEALNQAEHTIRLISFAPKPNGADGTFVSYRVGEYKDVQILLTDGKEAVRTNALSWKVQSVIDPQNPQAAQPFGPFGPWTISWPIWYFVILVLIVAIIVLGIVRAWKLGKRRIEIQRRIRDYRQKFNPFDQFQKTLRQMDRDLNKKTEDKDIKNAMEHLRQASFTYLMMEFEVDVERLSPKRIVRKLSRLSKGIKDSTLTDLGLYLSELHRRESQTDLEKMIEWAGRISEKVDRQSFGIKI